MLERILSGGQTGADQPGWRAAKAAGIPTGGAMPRGFLTEDGPQPEFAELFGAHELSTTSDALRTEANVRDAQATLWFGSTDSPGARCTLDARRLLRKRFLVVPLDDPPVRPREAARWIAEVGIKVLNVAGNRESTEPGIGERVEAFLTRVFKMLATNGSAVP